MTKETKEAFDERFVREMSENAADMLAVGVIDDATYKMTMRDLNRMTATDTVIELTGPQIKELREKAKLSQAVFARYLHLTVDHISKLERGAKRPTGPALVLLNVIKRKGIEAIL
jgi:putative transcriptional regulator